MAGTRLRPEFATVRRAPLACRRIHLAQTDGPAFLIRFSRRV